MYYRAFPKTSLHFTSLRLVLFGWLEAKVKKKRGAAIATPLFQLHSCRCHQHLRCTEKLRARGYDFFHYTGQRL